MDQQGDQGHVVFTRVWNPKTPTYTKHVPRPIQDTNISPKSVPKTPENSKNILKSNPTDPTQQKNTQETKIQVYQEHREPRRNNAQSLI